MKKYEEFLKRGNDIQNAFAIEYLLDYGRRNLSNDNFFENLQKDIKSKDDRNSIISNDFTLGAINIARNIAKLESKEIYKYIYQDMKEKQRHERSR